MKKTFLFLAAALMSAAMWADVTADTIFLKGFAGSTSTSYVSDLLTGSSQNGITVAASNFNPSTAQIKGNQTSATNNFYIYNTDAYPAAITKIEIIAKIDASNKFQNKMYAATGTASQAEITDVKVGAAWNLETASWTFDEADGVTYFKLYSNEKFTSGSVKEAKVVVTYGGTPTPQKELVSLEIGGTATKMEYFVGESFDPAGLTVTATYSDASSEDVANKATWTIEPATFTEASDNASVTVKAEFNKVESESKTITGIVVTAKVVPTGYASVYTSNVELTAEGGTSASAAKVVVGGTEYDAIKAGTGKVQGACVVTIPAATKMLHFHAAAWNKESVTLDVNGTEYALVADAGVSNNSPFTLQNDPATQDYFTFDPKGATTVTFAVTSGFRFVLFGVNAELEEGVVAAPVFTPTESEFDGSVEVTLTAEEGADIYYALNEEVTSMNAITYNEPIKLTETTTIYAIAKKGGKESAQVNKTYTMIPAYTVEEIAAITPTGQTFVLVLNDEEIVDLYTGKSGDISGLYFQATDKKIELYNQSYAFPKTWEKGGKVSGRVMGVWTDYNGQWELKIDAAEIEKLDYTAPQPTGINNAKANTKATKAIVNGQIVIVRDNKTYNVLGF